MSSLHSYLAGKSQSAFAKEVGISQPYLSQILGGKRRPGYDLMLRIEEKTEGEVGLSSWSRPSAEASNA